MPKHEFMGNYTSDPKTAKMRHIWANLGSRASPNISAYRDRGTLFDSPEEFVHRPLKMDT